MANAEPCLRGSGGRCRRAGRLHEAESDSRGRDRCSRSLERGASRLLSHPRARCPSRSTPRRQSFRGRAVYERQSPRATVRTGPPSRRLCSASGFGETGRLARLATAGAMAQTVADMPERAPRPRASKEGGAAWSRRYNSITPRKERLMSHRLATAVLGLLLAGSSGLLAQDKTLYGAATEAMNSGLKRLERQEYEAALKDFDAALTLAPALSDAIRHRGEAYLGLDRLADAKQAYMHLFVHDRTASSVLMRAMKSWVE